MSGPRRSLTKTQLEAPEAVDLLQVLHSVTADGTLTEVEVGELSGWLREHGGSAIPGIVYLAEVVARVVEDGIVTPEEREWVQKAIETILPATDREEASVRRREAKAAARRQAAAGRENDRQQARLARPIGRFDVMVAGVFHDNRQATINGIEEGEVITLVREVGNPYSQNAVLFLRPNGRSIGYLPESEAVEIAPLLDGGARYEAEVKKVLTGGHGLIPVVWGEIYSPGSDEGISCSRVAFVDGHHGVSAPARPPAVMLHPIAAHAGDDGGGSAAARVVVGAIGLLLAAMVAFAVWQALQ